MSQEAAPQSELSRPKVLHIVLGFAMLGAFGLVLPATHIGRLAVLRVEPELQVKNELRQLSVAAEAFKLNGFLGRAQD